jgi:hypothetical protein
MLLILLLSLRKIPHLSLKALLSSTFGGTTAAPGGSQYSLSCGAAFKLGDRLSVVDLVALGSSLSVRSFVRIGETGSPAMECNYK